MGMAWVRAWASTPMTNGRSCATIDIVIDGPLFVTGWDAAVAGGPAPVRVEVTSGHICDVSRPRDAWLGRLGSCSGHRWRTVGAISNTRSDPVYGCAT